MARIMNEVVKSTRAPRGSRLQTKGWSQEGALRMLGHGLEVLSRLKARAFFALGSPEASANLRSIGTKDANARPRGSDCAVMPVPATWSPRL